MTVEGLKPGTTYVFRVRARTDGGYGSYGGEIELETSHEGKVEAFKRRQEIVSLQLFALISFFQGPFQFFYYYYLIAVNQIHYGFIKSFCSIMCSPDWALSPWEAGMHGTYIGQYIVGRHTIDLVFDVYMQHTYLALQWSIKVIQSLWIASVHNCSGRPLFKFNALQLTGVGDWSV